MEKKWKPVPDVEALRYKGTSENPDIKIFVSHRIDLDSETIDNPLYIPVRCGAVYDEREDVTMLGDDTGDNISDRRESFCELTVQYWAWKNVEADYYGLCHYRRYLSFSGKEYVADKQSIVHEKKLGISTIQKHKLDDKNNITQQISCYDAIIAKDFDLREYPFPDKKRDVYQYWKELDQLFIDYKYISVMLEIISKMYPDYTDIAQKYMKGQKFLGYNCFILKKELFYDLCEFEFSILFEMERRIDFSNYSERMTRSLGYFSEVLYSIWLEKNVINRDQEIKYNRLQLVMFDNVEKDLERLTSPESMNNLVPIVVMSSKVYAAFSAPFLQSLVECTRNSNYKYEVIYLHNEISENDRKKLEQIVMTSGNICVKFINPDGLIDISRFFVATHNYAAEAYYRLLCPWILPKHYKKVLVFDIDLILKDDPANLYCIPLGNNWAAGVKDVLWQGLLNLHSNINDYAKNTLKLKNPYNYINTGVILLDIQRIRENFEFEYVLEFANSKRFMYQEQDIFNVLFEDHIHFLDVSWNYYVASNLDMQNGLSGAPNKAYRDYCDSNNQIKILHFAAQPKPWFAPEILNAEEYWNLARKTPFYEALISRMMDAKAIFYTSSAHGAHGSFNIADQRSGARRLADKVLPKGSKRREFAKVLLPKGSLRWRFCKQIYYIFKPQYRPVK